jgi:hypothetical protein
MGQFKETSFWVDARGNGWSYSLYMQPGRSGVDPNTAEMNDFVKKLAPLCGTGVRATFERESLRGSPKVSMLGEFSASAQYAGDPAKAIEQAGSVILCKCANADYSKKKDLYLHGVWDTAITGGALATPAGWAAVRNAFLTELETGRYYFLGKTGQTTAGIASVAQVNRKLLITTDSPFFPAPFDGSKRVEVAIKNLDTVPGLPNPVLVIPTSSTTAVTKNNFFDPRLQGGTIRINANDLIQIKHAWFERATTHRIGRPFKPSASGRYKRIH